jgi:hypothetical protein
VADDERIRLDDHVIDDQPEDVLLGFERRIVERVPNAVTERLQTLQQPEFLLTFRVLTVDLVEPDPQVVY